MLGGTEVSGMLEVLGGTEEPTMLGGTVVSGLSTERVEVG